MKFLKTDGPKGGKFAPRDKPMLSKATQVVEQAGKRSGAMTAKGVVIRKATLSKLEGTLVREVRTGRFLKNLVGVISGSDLEPDVGVTFNVRVGPQGEPVVTILQAGRGRAEKLGVHAPDLELEEALAAARARGQKRAAEIIAAPEMLNADAMADRLGVSRMTVNTWREEGRLLGLSGTKRGYRFPDWQLAPDGRPFAELVELRRLLGDPWAVYRFLVQPHGELDGATGLEALKRGKSAVVLSVAESVGWDFS